MPARLRRLFVVVKGDRDGCRYSKKEVGILNLLIVLFYVGGEDIVYRHKRESLSLPLVGELCGSFTHYVHLVGY
jgi:hypothetical protein